MILQGEIARTIAEQIEAELTQDEQSRLAARRPVAAKAYDAYLLGRYFLERAYQERSTVLAYLRIDPRLAPLRSDPRYADLVRRLAFPTRS
jgi:hypothetical protein